MSQREITEDQDDVIAGAENDCRGKKSVGEREKSWLD